MICFMPSGVERVVLILVPLSDKFDFISLFFIYFIACEQVSLDFVSSLTETVSYVVSNLKTKHHRNKNFHYILEL